MLSLLLITIWKIRNIIFVVFVFTGYSLENQKHHSRCFRFYWVQFGRSETSYSLFSLLLVTVWRIRNIIFVVFAFTGYSLEDQKHHIRWFRFNWLQFGGQKHQIRCFRFYWLQFGGSETSYSLFSFLLGTVWRIRNIIFVVFAFTGYSLEDQKHHIRCFRNYLVQFGRSETSYSLLSETSSKLYPTNKSENSEYDVSDPPNCTQ